MRVLLVHNYYQQPGGEDHVFQLEARLLERAGFQVQTFTATNDELKDASAARMAAQTLWNARAAQQVAHAARQHQAQIVHFHNTFPLLSPAVYSAARQQGAATVQTLHNYRLLCANAVLYRDGHVCHDCMGHPPLPAVMHRCYRDSLGASGVSAALQFTHRLRGTYHRDVDAFIVLNAFASQLFQRSGVIQGHKLHVLANAVESDPGPGEGGEAALFVGRLTVEKGVRTLLRAWETLGSTVPLEIAGDGPLAPEVQEAAQRLPGITYLGQRSRQQIVDLMKSSRFLVVPSEWYEGMPMTIIEAYAAGLPVLGSNLGSMAQLITPGVTGALFQAGDPDALIAGVQHLLEQDLPLLRQQARQRYQAEFTDEHHLEGLQRIYAAALAQRTQPKSQLTEET